jgi:hypothetical protein
LCAVEPFFLEIAMVARPSRLRMAAYTARAMLHGKGHDVWEMLVENIL